LAGAACTDTVSDGTVDGVRVDLSVYSAERFSVDGLWAGRIVLSDHSECPGVDPLAHAPSVMMTVGSGPGTYNMGVDLYLPSDDPTRSGRLVTGAGTLSLTVFGPTRATGRYEISFPGGSTFEGPFDVPLCGVDAGS
jgi:hypothetical protein